MMPEVRDSSGELRRDRSPSSRAVSPMPLISGVAGDQQAALFGQTCFEPGATKNTYGTGCFILMNTGEEPRASEARACSRRSPGASAGASSTRSRARSSSPAPPCSGCVTSSGIIESRGGERAARRRRSTDTGGVYLVPAFTGLGAPLLGPERAWRAARAHTRLESRARGAGHARVDRLPDAATSLRCFEEDTGLEARRACRSTAAPRANDFLMQFQADVLGIPVRRPEVLETTALGAAYLAGLAVGFWSDRSEIAANWNEERRFEPQLESAERAALWAGWRRAVAASRGWADPARRDAALRDHSRQDA